MCSILLFPLGGSFYIVINNTNNNINLKIESEKDNEIKELKDEIKIIRELYNKLNEEYNKLLNNYANLNKEYYKLLYYERNKLKDSL